MFYTGTIWLVCDNTDIWVQYGSVDMTLDRLLIYVGCAASPESCFTILIKSPYVYIGTAQGLCVTCVVEL